MEKDTAIEKAKIKREYYKEIEPIIKELASLFDPICSELCPGCTISCCEPCVRENGYYNDKEAQDFKCRYLFDKEKGFLGPQGCRIPRLYRSIRCLSHICLRIQLSIIKKSGAYEFTKMKEKIIELSNRHKEITARYAQR